eukprot:TRINITY_DN6808_c0_g1_i9.p2 TRINITY_DN6808_c0_g1~~TRINITY_DN6808_c0_g1_i9.p2  ORF type:complete len:101 (+),score=1.80 TRINITY_DN6808_c0_g1_i9:261-563(+)
MWLLRRGLQLKCGLSVRQLQLLQSQPEGFSSQEGSKVVIITGINCAQEQLEEKNDIGQFYYLIYSSIRFLMNLTRGCHTLLLLLETTHQKTQKKSASFSC